MIYKKDKEITVTFTPKEYEEFLFLQGLVVGTLSKTSENKELGLMLLRFIDKINDSNPSWISYFKKELGKEDEKNKKTN